MLQSPIYRLIMFLLQIAAMLACISAAYTLSVISRRAGVRTVPKHVATYEAVSSHDKVSSVSRALSYSVNSFSAI